jgi:hypothetical protein
MRTRRSRAAFAMGRHPSHRAVPTAWVGLVLLLMVVAPFVGWAAGEIPTSIMAPLVVGVTMGFAGGLLHLRRERRKVRRLEKERLRGQWARLMIQYGARRQQNCSEQADR